MIAHRNRVKNSHPGQQANRGRLRPRTLVRSYINAGTT